MADMLATAADLAAAMKTTVGDPGFNSTSATLALEVATGVVQAAAGQRIIQVVGDTATIDLDALDCGQYLYLPERPVTAVASAAVGGTPVTDFTVQLSKGRLWRSLGWRSSTLAYWNAPSTAAVVYTHGYPAGHQRLQLARGVTLDLAKGGYDAVSGAGVVVREQIDDYAVQYAAMTTTIEGALDPDGATARALRRAYGRPGRSVRLVASR